MIWTGRNDGDEVAHHRLYQRVIQTENYRSIKPGDFVLHGFAGDEGVRRNKGRVGARQAPDTIRKSLANFPVHQETLSLKDFGNIYCENNFLEEMQHRVSQAVEKVLKQGGRSIILGGGHELMYAHFSGLRLAFPEKKIGIINIDAHFDNREVNASTGATSGTGFWQIAQREDLYSLHIGIQKNANTLKLFETANRLNMPYILAEDIFYNNLEPILQKINMLATTVEVLYLTVCMDVFNASVAPGVSALAYHGIFADAVFLKMFRHILRSGKLMAMDVAEVNPGLDVDEKTARLAAALVNEWFMI